jgi:hypothetical protein
MKTGTEGPGLARTHEKGTAKQDQEGHGNEWSLQKAFGLEEPEGSEAPAGIRREGFGQMPWSLDSLAAWSLYL